MHLPARLGFVFVATLSVALAQNVGEIRETGQSPSVTQNLASLYDRDLATDASARTIDLRNHFTIAGVNPAQLVQIKTNLGTINAELLVADAPLTVANFKSYLATDSTTAAKKEKTYDNTFFHRAAENRDILDQFVSEFVIQGGGFRSVGGLPALAAKAPVVNEFKVANTRGTIAMAKVGPASGQAPTPTTINSATNQWFINLVNNSETLDTSNNGGFSVFARVLGKGMDVADDIAELPTYNLKAIYPDFDGALTEVPLYNVTAGQQELLLSNLVTVQSIRQLPLQPPAKGAGPSILTYTVTNTNPALAPATIANGKLRVVPAKFSGRSVITVRAAEAGGAFVESSFVLLRSGLPSIVSPLPATTTKPFGALATISAATSSWPVATIQWERKAPGAAGFTPILDSDPLFTGETTADLKIALNDTPTPAATFTALQNNQFRFVLTNDLGTTTSKPTTLKITTLVVGFSAQPPALVTGLLGGTVQFSVTALSVAANTPLTYRWHRLAPGSQTAIPLVNSAEGALTPFTGANTRTLTVKLDDLTLDGSQFFCILSNALKDAPPPVAATGTAQSKPAALRVLVERRTFVTAESRLLFGLVPNPEAGVRFTAKGLPAGLDLDSSEGVISGIPTAKAGIYKVTVTTTGPDGTSTQVYNIEVLALTGNNVGGFEALLAPADAPPAAKLTLAIASTGSFTGTLTDTVEKAPLGFKGAVIRSPAGVLSLASDLVIPIPGKPAGRDYLLTDLVVATNGKLSAKLKSRAAPGSTPVELGATTTGVHLASYSKTNAAPWAAMGVYNIALTKPALLAEVPDGGTAPAIPVGSGYARAPIAADGRLSFSGKLPDGSTFTASASSAADASYRLFARPYSAAPGAFLSADFKLAATSTRNPLNNQTFNRYALAAGSGEDVFWTRPGGIAKPATYPAGFGPLGLTLKLAPWIFFYGNDLGFKFSTDGKSATLGVAFSGPTLANATPNTRALPTDLAVEFAKLKFTDAALPDPSSLTLTFKQNTGLFTGSMAVTDTIPASGTTPARTETRKITIEGIFVLPLNVNNAGLANGTVTAEGFALVPSLPAKPAGPSTTERIRLHQPGAVSAP